MRTFFVCCFAVAAVGCNSEAKLGPVSGKVTIDGKPVTAGVVTFVAADQSNTAGCEIASDGTYAIADAPTGEVIISVRTRDHALILGPNAGPPQRDTEVMGSASTRQAKRRTRSTSRRRTATRTCRSPTCA